MKDVNANAQQKRERGEGRIFRRKHSRFLWLQYYRNGAQVRESAGTDDERKARNLLRKKLGAVANGIVQDSRSLRYEDIRDAYMLDYETNARKSLRRDREGKAYLESVRRLDEFFAGCRAVEIDADLMRKYQGEQQNSGLSNASINRAISSLRKMFTLAQRDGKLRNLPFFPMLPESRPRQGTLPHHRYAELVAALPDYIRPVVAIAFATGMRRGEILGKAKNPLEPGLRWSNILWMDRIIRIEDSKNGDAREIPFTAEMETMLQAQFAKRQEGCDYVCFRLDRKGHARRIGNFRKVWSRVCVKLGLGKMEPVLDRAGNPVFERRRYAHSKPRPKLRYSGLLLHDLRRTFISDAEHSGAPRHEAMQLSGHRTESVYKRYAISDRENRRAALDQIAAYRAQKFGDTTGTVSTKPGQDDSVVN